MESIARNSHYTPNPGAISSASNLCKPHPDANIYSFQALQPPPRCYSPWKASRTRVTAHPTLMTSTAPLPSTSVLYLQLPSCVNPTPMLVALSLERTRHYSRVATKKPTLVTSAASKLCKPHPDATCSPWEKSHSPHTNTKVTINLPPRCYLLGQPPSCACTDSLSKASASSRALPKKRPPSGP